MKCPECKANHPYKSGMKCRCGYRFSLDPKKDFYTDGKLLGDVAKASQQDTQYFTENQLYTAFCMRPPTWSWIAWSIACTIIVVVVTAIKESWAAAMVAVGVVGLLSVLVVFLRGRRRPPSRDRFKKLLDKYENGHGQLPKMLRTLQLGTPPPEWSEPDIYDYGVERLLVVQHEVLVDLLVKNNFHGENRALVLTGGGYPSYLVQPACKALTDDPDLPVFFLHDADPTGQQWATFMISEPKVMPWADHTKIDLGLHPVDVAKIKRLQSLRPDIQDFQLPVDALPYGMLALGLQNALEQKTTLTELLAMRETASQTDMIGSFG